MASLDPTGLLSDETAIAPPDPNSAAAAPELASIPSAPQVPDDQRTVTDSLAAQGAQAQYSADALRAGTEANAPAPGPAAPMTPQVAAALAATPPSADAPPSAALASNAPSAAPPSADAPPSANASAPTPPPSAAPIAVSGNAVAAASLPPAAASDTTPVRTASAAPPAANTPAAPPPGAEAAVPAVPPNGSIRSTMMMAPVMSDSALGFRASTAPALDASVSNFVSAPILTRYRQASAGGSGVSTAVAGPNGAVVAASPSVMGGAAPTAVVFFPGDGVLLSAAARTQIRTAATAFKAGGGSGSIRVVGHASSRTGNMAVEKHLEAIFEKSQKRANAVAQELIRQGVPADHLQIDAVGDSQPVYYESMPKGEEGNRRAEIFVQS
jgi:outer membrane protein OmpA-like peptidoglycan-associated protein